jgi:putative hydrolase of the HAD superfamily
MASRQRGIRAIVLDIGSVLEVIDDSVFPGPFEARHGLPPGATLDIPAFAGDPGVGELTESEVRAHFQRHLALTDAQADELMRDYWAWYCGTLDQQLFDWFAAQHGHVRTGIVSNSGPGAREAERHYGFEEITDDIVYSHEVGLAKPDPAIFALAARRLEVEAHEIVFLDDNQRCVDGALAAGWHAVRHVDTPTSIATLEAIIAREGGITPDAPGSRPG